MRSRDHQTSRYMVSQHTQVGPKVFFHDEIFVLLYFWSTFAMFDVMTTRKGVCPEETTQWTISDVDHLSYLISIYGAVLDLKFSSSLSWPLVKDKNTIIEI